MSSDERREMIKRMVDVVSEEYLEDLRWTVQQYAAKSLNEAMEDHKGHNSNTTRA